MNRFAGMFYARNPKELQDFGDAPCHIMGRHVLCARDSVSDGGAIALAVGRIRNAAELRGALACLPRKYRESDSALLLGAYRLWGEDCARRIEGPVQLIVMDQDAGVMMLSTDRMGEAGPLYYAPVCGSIAFSSHPFPLLRIEGVSRSVDCDGLRMIFGLGPARVPGRTPFKDIYQLEPGTMLLADEKGYRLKKWFELEARPHEDDEKTTVETVRGLLEQAIDDVAALDPLSMLSGGLDSTALTFLLARHGGPVKTFSVDYEDNGAHFQGGSYQPEQDAPYVEQAAGLLKSDHTRVVLPVDALAKTLDEAMEARGFPGMADIDSSLLLFMRRIAPHGKYVLSGECGDEVFGGYPWFNREELIMAEGFPWSGSMALRESVLKEDVRNALNLSGYCDGVYREAVARQKILPGEGAREVRLRLLQGLCFEFFMTNLQERAACMGARFGLGVLTPYCDERLVQYVYNVPWTMKRMMGIEKGLLRAAVGDILPGPLLMRKKSPYPKTYHPAYAQAVRGMMNEILENSLSPILQVADADVLRRLAASSLSPLETPWFGQLMAGPQMLAYLIQVNAWLEKSGAVING